MQIHCSLTTAAAVDLGEAYRRHRGELAAAAVRVLCRRDEVDDLLQDVFVEALRGIRNLREPAALCAWLTRVTVRTARRRLGRPRFIALDEHPEATEIADSAASPADRALLAALAEIMSALPSDRRRAWALRYVDGEQLDDIALRCRCSLATVKRRIAEVQAVLEQATADLPPALAPAPPPPALTPGEKPWSESLSS
jgi:RNA polymerase sigma-70 factor (ECF subfamily)